MSEDEKKAAAELQKKIDEENKSKGSSETRMESVEKMLKSILKNTEEIPTEPEIDFLNIDAEKLAKSMASDPEAQKDFLSLFIEHSTVEAIDLVDADGCALLTEDLQKSMDDSELQSAQILNLILQTLDANHERAAKRDEVVIAGMANMAKSFTETTAELVETTAELVELKKSIVGNTGTGEPGSMPDLNGNIQSPGSSDIGGLPLVEDGVDSDLIMDALQKSFFNGKTQATQSRYYELLENLNDGYTAEQIREAMSVSERSVFDSNLS